MAAGKARLPLSALWIFGLFIATWILLILPDLLLYWTGFPVQAAVRCVGAAGSARNDTFPTVLRTGAAHIWKQIRSDGS